MKEKNDRKRNGKKVEEQGEKKIREARQRETSLEDRRRGVRICTVNPADGHRLADGEQQQAGSTAGEVVVDLEHIQATLHRVETNVHTKDGK